MNPSDPYPWIGRLRHEQQPDDVTCGTSCLRMVAGMLLDREPSLDTFQVREMMGTNARTGTTDREMACGLDAFGIAHRRAEPREGASERLDRVVDLLRDGDLVLLRGMRYGCRHWMVGIGANPEGTSIVVADPGTGIEFLSREEIGEFLAPRGWEYWHVPAMSPVLDLEIRPVGRAGWSGMLDLCEKTFGSPATPYPADEVRDIIAEQADMHLSQGLYADGRLVACYALREAGLAEAFELEGVQASGMPEAIVRELEGLRTVWGVALACEEEERGKGYGRLMRTMPGALGFDASFGFQFASLGNQENWRRVRPWAAELGEVWLTAGRVAPLGPVMIAEDSTVLDAEYPAASRAP